MTSTTTLLTSVLLGIAVLSPVAAAQVPEPEVPPTECSLQTMPLTTYAQCLGGYYIYDYPEELLFWTCNYLFPPEFCDVTSR